MQKDEIKLHIADSNTKIAEVIQIIDRNTHGIVFVVDAEKSHPCSRGRRKSTSTLPIYSNPLKSFNCHRGKDDDEVY